MKKHSIELSATGTKDDLIDFMKTCLDLLNTAKVLEDKDAEFSNISGSMSKDDMKFNITTLVNNGT